MTGTGWRPYCGAAPTPAELPWRWNGDPLLILLLIGLALLGWRSRTSSARTLVGLLCAAVLFLSPFCALTSALFSVRTVHHMLLMLGLAPILSQWLAGRAGSLAAYTLAQAVLLWIWHAPAAYAAALSHDGLYWLMQATLLGSAALFWARLRHASPVAAVGALLFSMMQMGLLGALLTVSPSALYAPHWLTTQAWGLSPLEDQQLAGLIMWVPAAGVYLGAALLRLNRLLAPDMSRGAPA